METVSINGNDYIKVGQDEEHGEVFSRKGRYYHYSTRAHRLFPISKSKLGL